MLLAWGSATSRLPWWSTARPWGSGEGRPERERSLDRRVSRTRWLGRNRRWRSSSRWHEEGHRGETRRVASPIGAPAFCRLPLFRVTVGENDAASRFVGCIWLFYGLALCSLCSAAIVLAARQPAESRGSIQQRNPRQPWGCARGTTERRLQPPDQLGGESVPYAPPSPRMSFSRTSSHGIVLTEPDSNSCTRRRISASQAASTSSADSVGTLSRIKAASSALALGSNCRACLGSSSTVTLMMPS